MKAAFKDAAQRSSALDPYTEGDRDFNADRLDKERQEGMRPLDRETDLPEILEPVVDEFLWTRLNELRLRKVGNDPSFFD